MAYKLNQPKRTGRWLAIEKSPYNWTEVTVKIFYYIASRVGQDGSKVCRGGAKIKFDRGFTSTLLNQLE